MYGHRIRLTLLLRRAFDGIDSEVGRGLVLPVHARWEAATFAVRKVPEDEAEAVAARVDYLLMRLKQRTLGGAFSLVSLTLSDLQGHVDRRPGHVAPATIRKEIGTFRSARNWAARIGLRYCQLLWTGEFQAAGFWLTPSTKTVPLTISGRSVEPFNARHFFDADSISL